MPHHIARITSVAITATVMTAALPLLMAWPHQQTSVTDRYLGVHFATSRVAADARLPAGNVDEDSAQASRSRVATRGAPAAPASALRHPLTNAILASILTGPVSATSPESIRDLAAGARADLRTAESSWWRNASYLWWSAAVFLVSMGAAFWAYRRQR